MNINIINAYGFTPESYVLTSFGTGLINHTWLVKHKNSGEQYILQRVNNAIFKSPEDIAFNIREIDRFLKKNHPSYLFEAPLTTKEGTDLIKTEEGYFRLFRFVEDSHSADVVESTDQAYEAAFQFGTFTSLLNDFDATQLKITLPDFHNLPLRYNQFRLAIVNGNKNRIAQVKDEIKFLVNEQQLVDMAKLLPMLPVRVIHHDTKISNVLFNYKNKGLCVIDLDTIMPGHFVSDLGDMMRTYLSPVSEEECDFSKIEVRKDFFEAIVEGYIKPMKKVLIQAEKDYFFYAGQFMIYMQALRFITDYLNNDIYYGARYEDHNLIRGKNQITLLKRYNSNESAFNTILNRIIK